MTTHTPPSTRASRQACRVGITILLMAGFCLGQAAISLSPLSGPLTTKLRVSGTGFPPNSRIDIYFGRRDQAVVTANASGSFSQIVILVPASALPGSH